jgi:O-antigen/teichoic acid export membrane protein
MKIKEHIEELHIIDSQRKVWLRLSALVTVIVGGVAFGWDFITTNKFVWTLIAGGVGVSIIWWYWTMRLVRHLIHFKLVESELLIEIVEDIRHVKKEIKNIVNTVDNDK